MGRLRFKLSQRHSKAKDRKVHHGHGKMMHTKSSSSNSESRPQHRQISANNGLPRIPYIRCGFLQGKPPKVRPSCDEQQNNNTKLPQSPVNKKAADIPFPSARGASVPVLSSSPVTPLPKKWLTLGCDPCKQHNKLRHEDYKLQRRASPATATTAAPAADAAYDADDDDHRGGHRTRARGASASPAAAACSSVAGKDYGRGSLEDWEQEMCWKVVARSENEVVRKQVVLQKKSPSSSASKHSRSPSQEHHHHHQQQQHSSLAAVAMKNNFSRSVDWFMDESSAGAPDAATTASARNSCDSRKPGSEIGVFKLMTASPDQSMENDSFYAWDKDLSPFASESSIFTSFDSPQNLHKSSINRISVSPETRRLSSSSRYSSNMLKSPSPAKDDRKRTPHSRSQLKREEQQRRTNWTSPLPSSLFDEFQDTQKGCEDPEAFCRSWEGFKPCPSPLNIDQDTADYRNSSSNSAAPACSNHSSKTSSIEQMQQQVEYLSSQEDEFKHVKRKGCRKKHKEQGQEFTSRVMESFAVKKSSFNPYKDFRESMIEMILKKDLFEHRDLEELLRSYLMLNDVELHDLIVQVFTDLWYQLFSYDSS